MIFLFPIVLAAFEHDLSNDVWRFRLGDIPSAQAIDFDDTTWQKVSLPHTWNALDAQDGKSRLGERRSSGYRRTTGWYRLIVEVPEDYKDQRTFIRSSGACLVANVFVNGQLVGEHKGAFTAFCFEITDEVTPGEYALIAIEVDNSEHPELELGALNLEPGRKTLDIIPLRGDFNLYGGLYRGVQLITKPALCISPLDYASSGVYITTPEVSKSQALINADAVISVTPEMSNRATLTAVLRDANGQEVARDERQLQPREGARERLELMVDSPRLWDGVEDPYLYELEMALSAEGSDEADVVTQRVGIRTLIFDPERGFLLNGNPIRLRGVNRHQDWQDFGWAIGPEQHTTDFAMIREIGANAVRLAHYPQDSYVLDLCDQLGLIVLMEIPLVGWVDPSEEFNNNAKTQLLEMIHQYYNHPSIAIWGLWNELMNRAPDEMISPVPIVEELNAVAQDADTTRPTSGAANDTSSRAPGLRTVTDLISWNLYPGWYGDSAPADIDTEIQTKRKLDGRSWMGISEYGAGASIYQHEDWSSLQKPEPRGEWHPEEYQAYFHENTWPVIESAEGVWGSFVWNMFDFAADHRDEGDRPGINDKGLVTHDRKVRKDAFYFYKASWTDDPVVHLTSRRYDPRPAGTATLKVYSNADTVELFIDSQPIGPGTREGVVHVWEGVPLEPGEVHVRAVSIFDDEQVSDTVVWTVN